ncbi:MAG: hypothetical protein AAFY11_15710, partial [Cyanobacteria bacterium J06641_5]
MMLAHAALLRAVLGSRNFLGIGLLCCQHLLVALGDRKRLHFSMLDGQQPSIILATPSPVVLNSEAISERQSAQVKMRTRTYAGARFRLAASLQK